MVKYEECVTTTPKAALDAEIAPPGTEKASIEDEPAPPGLEDAADVKEADLTFARKAIQVPEDEKEWAPLHYLQNACTKGQDFYIDHAKKVIKFKTKEFAFDEETSFQASSDDSNAGDIWTSSGPFYNLITLALFVKCRGLKFTSYLKRIEAYDFVQYVKKADFEAVIQYLSGLGDKAPLNVRKSSEIKQQSKEEQKQFFNDKSTVLKRVKDSLYTVQDDSILPAVGNDSKIDTVFASDNDFYIGGVFIGKCDLRLMVKEGDLVMCQVHEMSSAEKRKLKKQIKTTLNLSHTVTMAYIGSEKRPKSSTITPVMSPELTAFLKPKGWTIEEFGALRTFGLRPPKEMDANDFGELVVQNDHAQVPLATNLAKKTMKIPSPDDVKVNELFETEEEVKIGVFMSKVLTKALINKIQQALKAKLQGFDKKTDPFATAQFSKDLDNQISKIAAAETALLKNKEKEVKEAENKKRSSDTKTSSTTSSTSSKKEEPPAKKKRTPITAPESPPRENFAEKLKEVEKELRKVIF